MREFMIEREIDGVGEFDSCQLGEPAETSNKAHASLSGFPANRVTEISSIIDPTTANSVSATDRTSEV